MPAQIDERVDARCVVETMNKQGCAVGTDDLSTPFRVIDLDHAAAPVARTARKCDYLFLSTGVGRTKLLVVPLELKSTGLRAATVVSQLQAGAGVAEGVARGVAPVRFVPVAVHGGRLHRRAYQELRKRRVIFRNERYQIVTMPCGTPLAAALV